MGERDENKDKECTCGSLDGFGLVCWGDVKLESVSILARCC